MEEKYMKRPLYSIGVAIALFVLALTQANAQGFVVPLTVSDDTNSVTLNVRQLGFGVHPSANACIVNTDSFFTGYGESELPPVPPVGAFDARFKDPTLPPVSACFGEGSRVDYRTSPSGPGEKDTFYVTFQDAGNFPVHLNWPSGLGANAVEMRIVDAITMGSIFDVDMLTLTNFDVNSPHVSFFIIMEAIYTPPGSSLFTSFTPAQIFNEDLLKPGKSQKPAKRVKPGKPMNMPNVSNLLSELVAQGGFQPGTSESDIAGGAVIGISYMENVGGKFKPRKDSAAVRAWVRLTKWDAGKNIGKSYNALQKTLRNKTFLHDAGLPRGFDSTGLPGAVKRKRMVKQATKLDAKKTPNRLFPELVALKVNIAASQLGKTPAGFGELIFDRNTSPYDEMSVNEISALADTMMTYWELYDGGPTYAAYDSLYSAVLGINAAFSVAGLDTASWQNNPNLDSAKLVLNGVIDEATVSYLKLPTPFVPTVITPTSILNDAPEDFEDGDYDDESLSPTAVKLFQNFPNPFNPATTIAFHLVGDAAVTVDVYNTLGQHIGTLLNNEEFESGVQTVEFDASELASGVYFYRVTGENLETGDQIAPAVGKMLLLK